MKIYYLIAAAYILLSFFTVTCQHFRRKRSEYSENTTQIGPSVEDKNVLREALQLLNIGKKTLGLSTENSDLLMQLLENSSDKAERVQHVLADPFQNNTLPKGEKYLALSGQDGHIRVDNYTNTTAISDELGSPDNETGADDIFKMVMEKRFPSRDGKGKLFHKITIIESNQLKPFDKNEFPQHVHPMFNRLKHHKTRSLKRVFSLPRSRKKRTKRYFFNRYPNDETVVEDVTQEYFDKRDMENSIVPFYGDKFFPTFHFHRINFPKSRMKKKSNSQIVSPEKNAFLEEEFKDIINLPHQSSTTEKVAENVDKSNSKELEKSLITQLMQFSMKNEANDAKLKLFYQLGIALFIILICLLFVLVLYKICSMSKNLKTLELSGANVMVKLSKSMPENFGRQFGFLSKNKTRFFEVPFGKVDYKLLSTEESTAELEWQSEEGEWLNDQDLDMKGVYT